MKTYPEPILVEFVKGDATGLMIPAHAAALRDAGPEFLTRAFHTFGSLPQDNEVARIVECERFGGGNSGDKLRLTVEYAKPDPNLHTHLFVKFSRDFADAFRDRRKYELEGEVQLASLSRLPAFPVTIPHAYFAEFHHESGTGILINQQILLGRDGNEPLRHKCMDHELPEPLAYYRPIVSSLARLVAAHKSGRLSPEVEQLFPFDRDAAVAEMAISWTEKQVERLLEGYADFIMGARALLPANVATPDFISRLQHDVRSFFHSQETVQRYLLGNPDFLALCHWNANIDNAWFWRDERGELQCGLLDWGMVRQMPIGYSLWSSLSMTTPDVWNAHLDELLTLFRDTLAANGGPSIDMAELNLHLNVSVATVGLALMLDAPAVILPRLPEIYDASGLLDPALHRDSVGRGFLQGFVTFLNLWETRDFGASLQELLRREQSRFGTAA